jgi:gliding motility-associated-like protein
MTLKTVLVSTMFLLGSSFAVADDYPSISPSATYIDSTGKEETSNDYTGSAPIIGRFMANPSDVGLWSEYYEWRFFKEGHDDAPYLIRYEQDTEFTFNEAGAHRIVCYAIFTQGNDTIAYTKDYWDDLGPLSLSVSESHLEMPNAFSPNNDGHNDIYGAKGVNDENSSGHWKSIVEFHATIFNRWGQKLYEWNDPAGGWDGTYKGKPVKQGVYYVLVKARGADGRVFNIKRDVNLLRGYTESTNSSSTGGGEE